MDQENYLKIYKFRFFISFTFHQTRLSQTTERGKFQVVGQSGHK